MYLLIIIGIITLLVYLYGTKDHKYFEKKGIKYVPNPIPFFGNAFRQITFKISVAEFFKEIYDAYPEERMVGEFHATHKTLVLRDPELIQHVMVTDFHHFYPRGVNPTKDVHEPLMKALFLVDGDIWKLLRQRLTPAFTSGKLKAMFPLIVERAEKLQRLAIEVSETGDEIDVRDVMARYTTDFIGACGFGIDTDSITDEASTFRQLGKRIFQVKTRDAIVSLLKVLLPETFKKLHFFSPEVEDKAISLVKQIMQQRNYKPSGRNDFIDLLLELSEKGVIVGESVEKRNPDGTPKIVDLVMDDLLMAAQVFIFFAAGFETSSSATSYTLHQLAFHPEEQKKCQEEIDEVLKRHGGKLSFDAVREMKYLDMCFREAMRIFPSLGFLSRVCASPYTMPGTNITIDEGVDIIIPVQALQMDDRFFDEPEKFIPDRFHPDNINNIKKHTYLPFGQGPRACIGERLGLMQSIAGLAALLSKVTVSPSKSTLRRPLVDPTSTVVQIIKGGVPLKLTARS